MKLIRHIIGILFSPRQTWQTIAAEQTDARGLYTGYIMPVALIPVCASLVGTVLAARASGQTAPASWLSIGIGTVVGYGLLLSIIGALACLANKLSPRFGGLSDPSKALQLAAYSATAGMVGSVFSVFPDLIIAGMLALLYSFYLMFLGAPAMLKTPQEKAFSFAFMMLICSLPIGAVFAGIFSLAFSLFR